LLRGAAVDAQNFAYLGPLGPWTGADLEQDYRRRVEAGTSHFLVQRAVRQPGHCGIENMVRQPAFDDLVNWIENRAEPAGDDVLGEVSQLGIRWTPLPQPKDPQQ
jgi:hypothetical protein